MGDILFTLILTGIEFIIGYFLFTDKIPAGIYDLLWYRWSGYFSRSVPDPDTRLLRWAGGIMMGDAVVVSLGAFFLSNGLPIWMTRLIGYSILACLTLAFVLPWFKPFQPSERERQWKEMVLDPEDKDKT